MFSAVHARKSPIESCFELVVMANAAAWLAHYFLKSMHKRCEIASQKIPDGNKEKCFYYSVNLFEVLPYRDYLNFECILIVFSLRKFTCNSNHVIPRNK